MHRVKKKMHRIEAHYWWKYATCELEEKKMISRELKEWRDKVEACKRENFTTEDRDVTNC